MNDEQAKALREPFKPSQIGKLPKLNCSACAQKKGGPAKDRHCDRHAVKKCGGCGNYLSEAHIHLDYVGHAAVTDRILSVDPDYVFGPVLDANKLPISRGPEVLHELNILGVSRQEWGEGPNMKECSSDAIRRCAMRFGVALDLWAKEDLQAQPEPNSAETESKPDYQPPKSRLEVAEGDAAKVITKAQQKRLWTIARQDANLTDAAVKNIVQAVTGQESTGAIPRHLYDEVISQILGAAA